MNNVLILQAVLRSAIDDEVSTDGGFTEGGLDAYFLVA